MNFNQYYLTLTKPDKVLSGQPGGYGLLSFIPVANVVSFIYATNPVSSDVKGFNLASGAKFSPCNMLINKRNLKEEQKPADPGDTMTHTLLGVWPFESKTNHKLLDILKYDKFIVVVGGYRGVHRVFGELENPCSLSHIYDSGTGPTDPPGSTLTFTWTSQDKPRLYVGGAGSGPGIDIAVPNVVVTNVTLPGEGL